MQGRFFQPRLHLTLVLVASALGHLTCTLGHSERAPAEVALAAAPPARHAEPGLGRAETILRERAPRLSLRERQAVAAELARGAELGLDPLLLLALIDQESRYDPCARGPRGSLGLMQVRPFVGRDVAERLRIPWQGSKTLVNPVLNVRIGVAYLAEMKRMYQQDELALAAYNMGPYRVKRLLASGQPPRSRYAALVLEGYAALQRRFSPLGPAAL